MHTWGDGDAPPLVCLHGVSAHGRRFRHLAEERFAERWRVLAPDLRGHGFSDWEPPWTFATHVHDVLETLDAYGVRHAAFLGHSFGGRLVLELAALAPERVETAVLLDPAIDVLPHVGYDWAEHERSDPAYAAPEAAIRERLESGWPTPREFAAEDVREHLVQSSDGLFRYRYCKSMSVSVYGELCTPAPPPETLHVPTLVVYAPDFGLVREEHIAAYAAALGGRLQVVTVPGGHMVFWDAYEQTADAVERFLDASR
jgi:lipase